jgi:hypothetical protein
MNFGVTGLIDYFASKNAARKDLDGSTLARTENYNFIFYANRTVLIPRPNATNCPCIEILSDKILFGTRPRVYDLEMPNREAYVKKVIARELATI